MSTFDELSANIQHENKEYIVSDNIRQCYQEQMRKRNENSWTIEKSTKTIEQWLKPGETKAGMGLPMIPFYAFHDMTEKLDPTAKTVFAMSQDMIMKNMMESIMTCMKSKC